MMGKVVCFGESCLFDRTAIQKIHMVVSFFLSFLLMIFFVSMILGLMDGEAVSLFFRSFLLFSHGDSIFKVGY